VLDRLIARVFRRGQPGLDLAGLGLGEGGEIGMNRLKKTLLPGVAGNEDADHHRQQHDRAQAVRVFRRHGAAGQPEERHADRGDQALAIALPEADRIGIDQVRGLGVGQMGDRAMGEAAVGLDPAHRISGIR
jgi:hypothetical protein